MSKTVFYRFSPFTREYLGTVAPISSSGDISHYPHDATTIAPMTDPESLAEDEVLIFHPVEGWIVEKKDTVKEKAFTDLVEEKNVVHHARVLSKGYWYDLIISPMTLEYLLLAYMSREIEIIVPVQHCDQYKEVKINRREFEDLMDQAFKSNELFYRERIKEFYTNKVTGDTHGK